ncbi:hypothetical protein BT96DRAFT_878368, partial [Gymnopus androsaceus JB14]
MNPFQTKYVFRSHRFSDGMNLGSHIYCFDRVRRSNSTCHTAVLLHYQSSSLPPPLMGLSQLPNELIAHILSFCIFHDILCCQRTCKHLNQVIKTSNIQYRILLEIGGLEDNPQCKLPIHDKLQLLQRREAAWSLFQPTFSQETSGPVDHTISVYELSGGMYIISGIARDVINTLRLPSAADEVMQWNHIPVHDSDLLDFGLAMTEHDLLGIITTSSDDDEFDTTVEIRFIQISTGLPHPFSGSPMQFKQPIYIDNLGVGIEIVGDLACLVIRDVSFGHHDRDKVLILNWKRGIVRAELYTDSRRYQSAIFLSPDVLLVTNAQERCLEIWRIPSEGQAVPKTPALILGLPAVNPGFMVSEFACRGAPNPTATAPKDVPFYSSPAQSIVVFHLTISPIDPRVPIPFIFFAHRAIFLRLLSQAKNGTTIPWSEWGKGKNTRWIHARSVPMEWITTTSGQRYAFVSTHAPALNQPIVVLDFNENHVRKVLADKKNQAPPYSGMFETTNDDWRRIWVESVPDTYEKMKVFKEDVAGELPYVAVKSSETHGFHGVLCDDAVRLFPKPLGFSALKALQRIIGIKVSYYYSSLSTEADEISEKPYWT